MRKNLAGVGELTEQIDLISRALTADEAGGATSAPTTYAPGIWAKVVPMKGAESQGSERTEAKGLFLLTIRNRDDVKEGHIARCNGRDLNIRFVRARGARDLYLQFEAEAGAAT